MLFLGGAWKWQPKVDAIVAKLHLYWWPGCRRTDGVEHRSARWDRPNQQTVYFTVCLLERPAVLNHAGGVDPLYRVTIVTWPVLVPSAAAARRFSSNSSISNSSTRS